MIVHIEVTPRAARHVRALLARDGRTTPGARYGLRVALAPGAADGHPYRLSLAPTAQPDELVLPRNGYDVFVARADADELDGVRIDFLESDAGSGFLVDRPAPARAAVAPTAWMPEAGSSPELERRVAAALEDVRPVLVGDGGDVELVGVADGAAYVRLQGACSGCGSALATLTQLIEATVASAVPEVPRTVLVA